jgi:hypothetical protein
MENNMKAQGIQLKTNQQPPKRIHFQYRMKGKEIEAFLITSETLYMEEVSKLLRSMANDLTKVKEGYGSHDFIGLPPRTKLLI